MSLILWHSEILVASVVSEDLEWAEDLRKSTGRTADLWCGEGEASKKCRRHAGRVSVVASVRILQGAVVSNPSVQTSLSHKGPA